MISRLLSHKLLILILICLIGFGFFALRVRGSFFSKAVAQVVNSTSDDSNYSPLPANPDALLATESASPSDDSVLGISTTSNNIGGAADLSTPMPLPSFSPLPSITPLPSSTPFPSTAPSSNSSACAGTPTEDNSQVYVGSKTSQVNSAVNISIELLDCNNSDVSSDHLTVTLSSGDAATTINGASSPVNIQAQNGKVTFSVNSPNPTTAVFTVKDTDHTLHVTAPGYKDPSVTFSNSGSCAGTPRGFNSEAISTSNSNNTGSIAIQLLDCNNNLAPVSDTLTISLNTTDSSLTINGSTPSVTVQTLNGQTTFSLISTINGTDTFTVADTTRGFNVTDSGNHNPSVTFSNSSATPTPSASPTASPTSSPSPTATASPTPSPTASASQTASPSP